MAPTALASRTTLCLSYGQSAGARRGLVGVLHPRLREASCVAEARRVARMDVRFHHHWRSDRARNIRAVLDCLFDRADWELLLSRPGHALIAERTGLCLRTVRRCITDLHRLGYLTTVELGTTSPIREGRSRGHDPYRGEGNHAQVYLLCLPQALAQQVADLHKDLTVRLSRTERSEVLGTPGDRPAHDQEQKPPSRRRRERAGSRATRVKPPAGGPQQPRTHRRPPRETWINVPPEQVGAVWNVLPPALTALLAPHESRRLVGEIGRILDAASPDHRTVDELAARIDARWPFWRYKVAAGLVRHPIAAAFMVIRRGLDCPDQRCEDGHQLDLDAPCKACELTAKEINEEKRSPETGVRGPECPSDNLGMVDRYSGQGSTLHAVRETYSPPPARQVLGGLPSSVRCCEDCGRPWPRTRINPPALCADCRPE
jgi:hypothetical protein